MSSKLPIRVGGKWTANAPGDRHFEIVSIRNDKVVLKCVVSQVVRGVTKDWLRQSAHWLPGWQQVD